jgi:hypothetical protein
MSTWVCDIWMLFWCYFQISDSHHVNIADAYIKCYLYLSATPLYVNISLVNIARIWCLANEWKKERKKKNIIKSQCWMFFFLKLLKFARIKILFTFSRVLIFSMLYIFDWTSRLLSYFYIFKYSVRCKMKLLAIWIF